MQPLSKREMETAQLVSTGKSGKQIAFAMGISHHTVKQHLKVIHKKLAVSNQVELIMRMIALGYIAVPVQDQS
jgi:DNA-binding CsgD family transcriptional regulator